MLQLWGVRAHTIVRSKRKTQGVWFSSSVRSSKVSKHKPGQCQQNVSPESTVVKPDNTIVKPTTLVSYVSVKDVEDLAYLKSKRDDTFGGSTKTVHREKRI